jgi:hypothetical protein
MDILEEIELWFPIIVGHPLNILEHKLEWLTGDTDDAYGEIGLIVKRKII